MEYGFKKEFYLTRNLKKITISTEMIPASESSPQIIYKCQNISDDILNLCNQSSLFEQLDKNLEKYIIYASDLVNYSETEALVLYDNLLKALKKIHPFFSSETTVDNITNAEHYIINELYQRYTSLIDKQIYDFILEKQYLQRNENIASANEFAQRFTSAEKEYHLQADGTPRSYRGHNTSEILSAQNNHADYFKSLKLPFKLIYCQKFAQIFYPVFYRMPLPVGHIKPSILKKITSFGGKNINLLHISEEYITLFKKYEDLIDTAWEKNLNSKLLTPNKSQKFQKITPTTRKLYNALLVYMHLATDEPNDLCSTLSDAQKCYYYFFLTYNYVKESLDSIVQHSQPALLYQKLFLDSDNLLMVPHNVINDLEFSRSAYKKAYISNDEATKELNQTEFIQKTTQKLSTNFDLFNIQVYQFQSFEQLVYLELFFAMQSGLLVKKCNTCHKYFFFTDSKRKYCNDCKKITKYISQTNYQKSKKKSPAYSAYIKEYNKYSKKIERETDELKRTIWTNARSVV